MTDASKCGNFNEIPGISFFTAAATAVLTVATTIAHCLILYAIIKDRGKKFKIFFYKLLLNISIADVLSGIFNDPYAVIFHAQEGLHKTPIDIRVFHVSLFLLGGIPLFTMVMLAVDRILALMNPTVYRNGFQGLKSWLILAAIWFISILQIIAYFQMGFIPYLVLFAGINIAVAVIAMLVTFGFYHKNLGRSTKTSSQSMNGGEKPSRRRQEREKKATRTFLFMSMVIVFSYMPTCFATGYMNSCTNCDCAIVHSLRDIAIVSILAGPLFRAINFMVCLKSLRTGLCIIRIERRPAESSQASSDQPKLRNSEAGKSSNKEDVSEKEAKNRETSI